MRAVDYAWKHAEEKPFANHRFALRLASLACVPVFLIFYLSFFELGCGEVTAGWTPSAEAGWRRSRRPKPSKALPCEQIFDLRSGAEPGAEPDAERPAVEISYVLERPGIMR